MGGYKDSVTLVDTHCHLSDARAFPDPRLEIETALAAGVRRMVTIGIDGDSSNDAIRLAETHREVYATAGWHPNHASDYSAAGLLKIEVLLAHPKCVALGEIGLDFYRDHASRGDQERAFRDQLALALDVRKPVVIHCREAYSELLAILEGGPAPPLIFHCFSGDATDLRRALDLGAWIGVDGPITYKSGDPLRQVLYQVPMDKLLVETDAPYMAPEPHRGKTNRPAWVTYVNAGLARVKGLTETETALATTTNALAVFGPLGL